MDSKVIYFDGVHLASPDVQALHAFASLIGLKRCWFEGSGKGHPHYDVKNVMHIEKFLVANVICCSARELVKTCYKGK